MSLPQKVLFVLLADKFSGAFDVKHHGLFVPSV